MVKRGQRMAEWDPYTRPIITEVDGSVGLEDLVDGQSVAETQDESTGITKRVVTDWRTSRVRRICVRRSSIKGKDGKVLKLARGGEARYHAGGRRHSVGRRGCQGDGRATSSPVSRRKAPRRATSPAVCRGWRNCSRRGVRRKRRSSPKSPAPSASAATTRTSVASRSSRPRRTRSRVEYLIPKGKHIHLQDGDLIEKGDFIVEGNPAPHDILAIKGVEELAAYLVNEIQEVYRLQGVRINDKHIEVIVRQMLQKVEIADQGETDLIPGEQLDAIELDAINVQGEGRGQEAGDGTPGAARHHQGQLADPLLHSRRRRSRRPRACSPRLPSTARSTRSKASRKTSSSAA